MVYVPAAEIQPKNALARGNINRSRKKDRRGDAQTSVTRALFRRRGDGLPCHCCTPQWFHVAPLPDMRTDRRHGIRHSARDPPGQGDSMAMPVRKYAGGPDKPSRSACAHREGVGPRCRITPSVNFDGGRRGEQRALSRVTARVNKNERKRGYGFRRNPFVFFGSGARI